MSSSGLIISDDASGPKGETLEMCTPLQWPQQSQVDEDFVKLAATRMLACTHRGHDLLALFVFPASTVLKLLRNAIAKLSNEQSLLDVAVEPDATAQVIGDIHGDYHSLIEALDRTGLPSDKNKLVFLGDFVDRGPWGVEVMFLVLLLKAWRPESVFLLRGNHETTGCTQRYGFVDEVCRKYSNKNMHLFYNIFRQLPLAAVIHLVPSAGAGKADTKATKPEQRKSKRVQKQQSRQATTSNVYGGTRWGTEALPGERRILAVHGGLFRSPQGRQTGKLEVGTLADIAEAIRRYDDPIDCVAEDVLWSDPQVERNGVEKNKLRGAGVLYGATAVEFFLRGNGLHGIVRAHEGPDMREKREKMNAMLDGFSVDIESAGGYVATVFSAADYPPQKPRGNLAAVATLHGRGLAEANAAALPKFTSFAVECRPDEVELFYEENDGAVTPRTSFS